MSNLNKIYHKGTFRGGEWGKHIRPYLKRLGNKRWRKTGKGLPELEEHTNGFKARRKIKKEIKVRITLSLYGDRKITHFTRYKTMRDAENAMNRGNVIRAEIISK